ncbi:S8 family peptidase [Chondromyces apiculatus]|uniref:Protease n=1 Tax=Chondromyces apiculatus DSM 436 TaxID=1192034 RepID=A0A017T618_9BACT|nr:S8 family peptidase [Chondromyces apiculatus]EYF04026.1 Protease [Chondromyces apiculatus DSM 436]
MHTHRSLTVFAASLLAVVASALPGVARADEPVSPGPLTGPGDLRGPAARSPVNLVEPVGLATDAVLGLEMPDLEASSYDIPGQIVVDARDDLDAEGLLDLATGVGVSFVPTALAGETKIQIASVAKGNEQQVMERLARDPRVEAVEPLARVQALFTPNDPLLKNQWHMGRVGAPRAWDFATGRGVTVAVVDTGIACETHGPFTKGTDLADTACVPGWSFVDKSEHASDDHGHGTHVAGTIAQSTNNGLGAAGLAFHARLMPVKVLNANGWGTTADVADGIRWAADHGAHVINLSLGGPRNSKVLQSAVEHAMSRGAVVIAAAGNTGGPVGFPGATEGVIAVSATGEDDKIARFSSRGEEVDIAAPGVNVTQQTVCNGGRNKCERFPAFSGTSMASPHVAGAAALVMSLGVTEPKAVEEVLRATARVVDESEGAKKLYGAGLLHADAAVARVTQIHAVVRFVALLALTAFLAHGVARKGRGSVSPWRPSFLLAALIAGPGLLFFAPWVLTRAMLPVDLLARPFADLDLLIGLSVHRWLPLANALIPFGLTALFFGVKKLRPAVAGFATGTAAYLTSIVVLGEVSGPVGQVGLVVWCAVNAAACLWIARTNLVEER